MTASQKTIRTMAVWLLATVFAVGAFAVVSAYQGRLDIWHSQLAGCKRGKLDRSDNADFQKAYTVYNGKVTKAASVKEDVKVAARRLRSTVKRTSESLLSRTGENLDCDAAFPRPSVF